VSQSGIGQTAITIITPYYNTGRIFMETVQSVLTQSLQQWEWLIVNDGSTDQAALRALEPFRDCRDSRIRVLDQPNRGLPSARNAGVAASGAPLLFFLDSDDLIERTALEKMAWLLHSDPRSAFVTSWSTGFGAQKYDWPRGFEVGIRFLFENTVTPMVMMRRAVFKAVGGFDETRIHGLEDYEFWLRCAALGYWGRDIPEFLIHLRRKAPEQYPGYSWPLRDDPRRYRAFLGEMRSHYPQLFRQGLPYLSAVDEQLDKSLPQHVPFTNVLPVNGKCLLLLLFQLNGARRPFLAMLAQLRQQGYACTVCVVATGPHPLFADVQLHADVFVLDHFLLPADYPRFLLYLVRSRGFEAVLLDNNQVCYSLAAYLRAFCSPVVLLDYTFAGAPGDGDPAYRGLSVESPELLDLQLVSSPELRDRAVRRGVPPERCVVVAGLLGIDSGSPGVTRGERNLGEDVRSRAASQIGRQLDSLLALVRANKHGRLELSLDRAAGLAAGARAVEVIRKRSSHGQSPVLPLFWMRLIPDQRQQVAWMHAYRRLMVWIYPLYRILGSRRLRLIRRPVRKVLGLLHTRSGKMRTNWTADQQRLF
jgi:hypothetical protein